MRENSLGPRCDRPGWSIRRTNPASNFIGPAWFDADAKSGNRLDHLGNVRAPFTLTKGGYVVELREGKASQV